nr:hypothetical protein [Angustibacter aerolatus]
MVKSLSTSGGSSYGVGRARGRGPSRGAEQGWKGQPRLTDTHDPLRDEHLEDEIEMVGDLVVAATGATGPLTQDQIDAVLGVSPRDAEDGSEAGDEDAVG